MKKTNKNFTDIEYNAVGGMDAIFNGMPYTLTPHEVAKASKGEFGQIKAKSAKSKMIEESRNDLEERAWRDGELTKADIELYLVQDGRGQGTVKNWRDFRNLLRDWPEHNEFPDSTYRPTFEDAVNGN